MHPYLEEGGGRSPGGSQLCAWGHGQRPEKRPHLLGPPEGLSMKGLRPGPWPISEWAWGGPGVPQADCPRTQTPGQLRTLVTRGRGRRPRPRHGGGGRLLSTGTAPLADPPQARPRGCPPGPR
ncbi:unnamed protein product [Nyctereutes procyonoides]|uniref:(raccoon dog) hypothetical protein n=1 Tax=Nyctereutes procyonoides TaxID=34880 RepID=A0A811Y4F6_NYCPR|nr:unnamed protein product [Nyctereutes procyonoides]